MEVFAVKLKELREEKRLMQIKLAEVLKCRPMTITNYEKGKSCPSLRLLCMIAQYFAVSTDYLLGMSDIRQGNQCNNKLYYMSKKLDEEGRQKVEQFIEFLIYQKEINR